MYNSQDIYKDAKKVQENIDNTLSYYRQYGIGGKWTAELFEDTIEKVCAFLENNFSVTSVFADYPRQKALFKYSADDTDDIDYTDDIEIYKTDCLYCLEEFEFTKDDIDENGWVACPKCGGEHETKGFI